MSSDKIIGKTNEDNGKTHRNNNKRVNKRLFGNNANV